ncbi:MAG TPA: 6-hydroxymethylpterin diphosphokinase MptE-like protein, partial [Rectinemataceae bacterium]|nr:6-hydroxymethylpterin diphosphokinase MptE-like protein [Rectinemataceae bacterium]
MSDLVFKRNLLALSRSDPSLGDRLLSVEPDTRLILRSARSGAAVPVLRLAEREVAFHSLIDPEREAERMVSAQPPGGFIVALGLGAGYLLRAYLASTSTTGLVVVEHSASLLRALLELIDLSELFIDQRFSLMLDPEPDELSAQLLTMYVPPLAGDLRSLPLRGRVDLDKDRFQRSADAVRDVLGRISDDYSVQAFFGKLWLKNAARNLFSSEGAGAVLPPVRRAAVAAAGPSLEASIPLLARAKDGGAFIIATDTSLPALLGAGLEPNVVISIDCQHISYYHFLGGFPAALPLVLDLSSPNRIARMGAPVRFFSSGHPFCAYISSRHRAFPALDTSGGNV